MALRLALLPCLVAAGGRDAFGRWNTQAVEPLLREVARAKRNAEESLGSVEPLRAAIEVTTSTLERVTASTLERTEEALASLVSDPTWALREVQRRLESVEPPAWSLPWLRQGLHSHRAWQRAGRMLRSGRVEDLSGSWSLEERHNMDAFLRSMGFNAVQRAAVMTAGQVQVLTCDGRKLRIVSRDVRGTSELVLPIGGPAVQSADGDGDQPIVRRAFAEGDDLVITETAVGERQPLSECRRRLRDDGRMCVDVRKRTPNGDIASMRIVFSSVPPKQRCASSADSGNRSGV